MFHNSITFLIGGVNENSEALTKALNEFRSTLDAHDQSDEAGPSSSIIESESSVLENAVACDVTENLCDEHDAIALFAVLDSTDKAGPSKLNVETDHDGSVIQDDNVACEVTVSVKKRKKRNADGIELDPSLVDVPRSFRNVPRRPVLSKKNKFISFIK